MRHHILLAIFLLCSSATAEEKQGVSYSESPWVKSDAPITGVKQGRGIQDKVQVKFYSTLTRLGRLDIPMILNATDMIGHVLNMTQTHNQPNPDAIIHGAVAVYGNVFEFIFDKGIDVVDEVAYLKDNTPLWVEDGTFETKKSVEDVHKWIKSSVKDFSQETYHVVDRNCLDFSKAFSEFLGGTTTDKYVKQSQWLQENRLLGELLQFALKASYRLAQLRAAAG